MVSPAEWGPNAWKLLHGIAERVGRHSIFLMARDEQLALGFTLKRFWQLLPCKQCQTHYREWLHKSPSDAFTSKSGAYLREDMRHWVFRLHEDVNARRGLESGFQMDTLQATYSNLPLREYANHLKSFYQRGVLAKVLQPEEWKAAWKQLDLLLRFIGV